MSEEIQLDDFYAGGAKVGSNVLGASGAIPTSGELAFDKFYSAPVPISITYNGTSETVTSEYTTGSWNTSSASITVDVTGARAVKSAQIRTDQGSDGSDLGTTLGVKLTGEILDGSIGTLVRGSISETGPVLTPSTATNSSGNHGVTHLEAPTNAFLVGIKLDGGGGREHDDVRARHRTRAWVRYAQFTDSDGYNVSWSGNVVVNGTVTTEPGTGHGNYPNPGTTGYYSVPAIGAGTVCTGIRVGTGHAGEYTDNVWYNELEMGFLSRGALG